MHSTLSYQFQRGVFSGIERLNALFSRVGDSPFIGTDKFSWIPTMEANIGIIQQELQAIIHVVALPSIQDISPDQQVLTTDDKWKVFGFYFCGHKAEHNCHQCPQTAALLKTIPGLKSAMFSVLAPQKHIPAHRGVYNGMLRYHLGLQIPENDRQCGINVGGETRYWANGESLVFNENYQHDAWNFTDFTRVVLIVDFDRPLYWPFNLLNQWAIAYIAKTPFVTGAVSNLITQSSQQVEPISH
ncbi:MAG: aspartyl/asparaginyl beta-hydroxylase domain-containing protein [Methylococcaceae bacterium]|nr:aspartyl/asparaginyl beta-hydroxylase domain-containing protein [Methylococcaceae bacterium]